MVSRGQPPTYRLDDIDRRIIYELMRNARGTAAPAIAEAVNVSPATIRNRIDQLETHGIIRAYTAVIDFERADGRLSNLYLCTVPVSDRESLAQEARAIPGVVNVRELMTGRRNLHVLAVGADTEDLRRIARTLSELGIEIEDEDLVQHEWSSPYTPFGPSDDSPIRGPADFISLAGDTDVLEVTVHESAPIVDHTLESAGSAGILDESILVIAIERGDRMLTPRGRSVIQADDVVTLLVRGGGVDQVLEAFLGDREHHTVEP